MLNEKKKTVSIITNNVNCERHIQYYAKIEKYYKINGWKISTNYDSDMVVICACGYHNIMYEKVQTIMEQLRAVNYPKDRIILLGCLPKTHESKLKRDFEGIIIPLRSEYELDKLINADIAFRDVGVSNTFNLPRESNAKVEEDLYYIKISDGCLRKCTYCVINRAKGPIRSINEETIVKQYKDAISHGRNKIFLMGDDTFAYGYDTGTTIVSLINKLLEIESNVELYFGALHINWLELYSKDIISLCERGIVKQLNIGLQHVNNYMLSKMGRETDFVNLYEILKKLKNVCPDIWIEADIIVGFPGETEEIFEELVAFFRQDKCFNIVGHSAYCDVEGAPSCGFENKVSETEKLDRWNYLKDVLQERSVYNRKDKNDLGTISSQLTLSKDLFFCKDCYNDEYEVGKDRNLIAAHNSTIQEDGDFNF